jgi:uncharacterized membrane protein
MDWRIQIGQNLIAIIILITIGLTVYLRKERITLKEFIRRFKT